ncbi:MAG: type VI secretion system tip protein VgrG [Gammaproteobacteria bacterium]|nr:type VI secretion system tip protein VgrG [Gammaproteobacteria bacterium]
MPRLAPNISRFEFVIADLDAELRVVKFTGTELVSRMYRYEIELVSEDHEILFDAVVDKSAVLVLLAEAEPRYIHGIISRFEQGQQGDRFTVYYATLVPKVWRLSQRYGSRIFQQKTAPEIIGQILDEVGVANDEYSQILQGTHPTREYCVQYRESELNFISRLMEEEGVFYFFEQQESKHVMVMGDNPSAHPDIADGGAVLYHEFAAGSVSEDHIYHFSYIEQIRPGVATLRDYNFKKPTQNLESQKEADQDQFLEVYDYPGEYDDADVGTALAGVRLEEQRALRKMGRGESNCTRLIPGYTFTMEEHVRSTFNTKYLVISLETTGAQPEVLEEAATGGGTEYSNHFRCIPYEVPYRPARITRRPVVEGVQTAIVVGPSGEEIYTDEFGRIKVQFHWDREGAADEKSSCWIRVNQAWAGPGWGALYLPRVGHEVIVDFIEGDPDRPIITGRVYHGTNRPPYPLPDEKTKSTLKSNSSKGGGGYNEIRLEDKKGEEQIFVHAERNQDVRVKADAMEWIGNKRHLLVKKDQIEKVEENKHQTVVMDRVEKIEGDSHRTISGDSLEQIDGTEHLGVTGDRKVAITGGDNLKAKEYNVETSTGLSVKAGMDLQQKVGMNYATDAGMGIHLKAGMNVVIEAGLSVTLKAGGGFIVVGPAGVTISGTPVLINSGGAAGAGSGCSPKAPASPSGPNEPEEPVEADSSKAGKVAKPKAKEKPPKPKKYSAQALVLKQAAKDGTPFCEECEKARQSKGG